MAHSVLCSVCWCKCKMPLLKAVELLQIHPGAAESRARRSAGLLERADAGSLVLLWWYWQNAHWTLGFDTSPEAEPALRGRVPVLAHTSDHCCCGQRSLRNSCFPGAVSSGEDSGVHLWLVPCCGHWSSGASCQPVIHKTPHRLAFSRSAGWHWEVSGAREDGRTLRTITAQLIKSAGSCMQKALLPVLLCDATAGLGSHGVCPPEMSLPCSPSCEGYRILVSPCGSSSPHLPISCAGEMLCAELLACLETEACLL